MTAARVVHVLSVGTLDHITDITLCPEGETPYDAFVRIRSNVHHFGGTIADISRTWPLGAASRDAIEIRFHVPGDRGDDREAILPMWHVLAAARLDEWAAKP